MRSDPQLRVDAGVVSTHLVIVRARASMDELRRELGPVFRASALAGVPQGWLSDMLSLSHTWDGVEDSEDNMDVSL
jgi:mitosis inhibitor protein kinase SWE1